MEGRISHGTGRSNEPRRVDQLTVQTQPKHANAPLEAPSPLGVVIECLVHDPVEERMAVHQQRLSGQRLPQRG